MEPTTVAGIAATAALVKTAAPILVPLGDALRAAGSSVASKGAEYLDLLARPVAEEFGLLSRDALRGYRLGNIAKVLARAEAIQGILGTPGDCGAPRVVMRLIEEASWVEDEELQELWSGLLASSCSPDGRDESNLPFVNKLRELTSRQAKVLRRACEGATKVIDPSGLIAAPGSSTGNEPFIITVAELYAICGSSDIHALDVDLDALRHLGLVSDTSGFMTGGPSEKVALDPTPFALNLFVRAAGSRLSVPEFFALRPPTPSPA